MKKLMILIALILTFSFFVGCSKDSPTESEKEHTAQIIKELEGVQSGDIIQTKDGSLAVVVRRLDEATRIKFVCTNQVSNWYDWNTAHNIDKVIHVGDDDWCSSAFKILTE